jgi:hypothetical protein
MLLPTLLFASGEEETANTVQSASVVVPRIEYLEGEVTVDGVPAYLGMEVRAGSAVKVAPESLCEVTFERNILRIYAGTSAVIDVGAVTSRVTVNSGAVAAVLDKLGAVGNDGRFQFDTPTAVGGVRGTVFYIRVEDPDNTFVCVCNGTVDLASSLGTDEQVVEAAHHSGLRFSRGGDGAITASVPEMAYHTDEEMESLAERIGVQIDWKTPL